MCTEPTSMVTRRDDAQMEATDSFTLCSKTDHQNKQEAVCFLDTSWRNLQLPLWHHLTSKTQSILKRKKICTTNLTRIINLTQSKVSSLNMNWICFKVTLCENHKQTTVLHHFFLLNGENVPTPSLYFEMNYTINLHNLGKLVKMITSFHDKINEMLRWSDLVHFHCYQFPITVSRHHLPHLLILIP